MVTVDNWVKSLSEDDSSEPPLALAEMADRVARSKTELRSVFEDTKKSETAVLRAAETSALDQQRTLLALTILIAMLAVAGVCLTLASVVQIARRSHRKAQLATIDSLTGIGNRHQLEERTRPLASDPRFAEHFVAIVDLDRFKMINDLFGHAAGDAILVEVASQLENVGRDVTEWFPGAEYTVIRLGGDEFLLSIHSPGPIDVERIRDRIESIRERTIAFGDGTMRSLDFSVGIAGAGHLPNLSEMMGAADLAVYENKSTRAHLRAANPGSHDDITATDADPVAARTISAEGR
jgi:diguanylate cyclase (GGDEF)-like protein